MQKKPHFLIQCILLMTLLLCVMVQGFTHKIPMKPLNGFTDELVPVKCSFKTYLDSTYQDYLTEYAKLNTGFREVLIRSYNQMCFSCFDKVTNTNITKGRHNELFLYSYLEEATGKQLGYYFPSIEAAKAEAEKNVRETLAYIDTLQQHGKKFLFVFCPTKTAVYREDLPKWYQDHFADFSLEEYYIELFKKYDIPHIDFYHYFLEIKEDFPYPLYPKTGSHWSEATIPFLSDSIYKKLEEVTGYKLPRIQVVDQNITTEYSRVDGELEANLNLLFPLDKPAIPYPICTLRDTVGKDRPNLLVIADSYFNQFRLSAFVNAFNHWDYWIYNKTVYASRPFYDGKQMVNVFDPADVIEEADIVLAMFTSIYLHDYLFGFIPFTEKLLREGNPTDEECYQQIIKNIKENPEWYEQIVKQAEERGISVEENMLNNAKYVLWDYRQQKEKSLNN